MCFSDFNIVTFSLVRSYFYPSVFWYLPFSDWNFSSRSFTLIGTDLPFFFFVDLEPLLKVSIDREIIVSF